MCLFAERYREHPSFHKSSRWQMPTEESDATFCGGSRSTILQARAKDKQLPCLTNILRIWKISYSAALGSSSNLRLVQPVLSKVLATVLSFGCPYLFSKVNAIALTVSAWSFNLATSVRGNLNHGNALSQAPLSGMAFGASTWAPLTRGSAEEPPHRLRAWCDQPLAE